MPNSIKFNSIIISLIFLLTGNYKAQNIQTYINDLYSEDTMTRWQAVSYINEYKIIEAFPILKELIYPEESENLKLDYIESMGFLADEDEGKKDTVINIAKDLIINAGQYFKTYGDKISNSVLEARVRLTYILTKLGDFSTINYTFERLDQNGEKSDVNALLTLPLIINHEPVHKERCRGYLRKIAQEDLLPIGRFNALFYLYEEFGNEEEEQFLSSFKNDTSFSNRTSALEYLFLIKYPKLDSLLKYHLVNDSEDNIRDIAADSLLHHFGNPPDLKAVMNHQPNEPDTLTKSLMYFYIQRFIPPEPDSSVSAIQISQDLLGYSDSLFLYHWIPADSTYNNYKMELTSIKNAVQTGDISSLTLINDELNKVEAEFASKIITREAYLFLHYPLIYIKERLE